MFRLLFFFSTAKPIDTDFTPTWAPQTLARCRVAVAPFGRRVEEQTLQPRSARPTTVKVLGSQKTWILSRVQTHQKELSAKGCTSCRWVAPSCRQSRSQRWASRQTCYHGIWEHHPVGMASGLLWLERLVAGAVMTRLHHSTSVGCHRYRRRSRMVAAARSPHPELARHSRWSGSRWCCILPWTVAKGL